MARKDRKQMTAKVLALAALGISFACATDARAETVTWPITPTKAQQRYPWNGLVDIELNADAVDFDAWSNIALYLSAKDRSTGATLPVETLTLDGETFLNGVTVVTNANLHLVWDSLADVGEEVVVTNASFYAAMAPKTEYMVIDISGGSSASSYPVTYSFDAPSGGVTGDAYKTTKIVMRRVLAGTFTMGSPSSELGRGTLNETQHAVTLTSDFWIGVYEMTQTQYELLMGTNTAYYGGTMCPVESVSYETIVGTDGPLDRLAAKTGLSFALPTEAQWEYACRAGTTNAWNNGTDIASTTSDANLTLLGRYYYNGGATNAHTNVGSYLPNAWGLYDMHGNVSEWCLDWFVYSISGYTTDPTGPESGDGRSIRGGNWESSAKECRSACRTYWDPSDGDDEIGFRLACPAD